jgi:hypothetical protein
MSRKIIFEDRFVSLLSKSQYSHLTFLATNAPRKSEESVSCPLQEMRIMTQL